MKEYLLSSDLDRLPLISETEVEQDLSVSKDMRLLNEWKHATVCGCGSCKGFAIHVHDSLRPKPPETAIAKKGRRTIAPASPLEENPDGWE